MTKRIFRSILLVAAIVLIASVAIILGFLYEYFTKAASDRLSAQMDLAVQGVENEGIAYFDGLKVNGYRITWVDESGSVLYDSEAEHDEMENHSEREEIKEALTNGIGESFRYSSTLSEKTMYYARRLPDGTILRMSITQNSVFMLALGMYQPILIVLAVAIVFSAALANNMSKRIVRPLNELNLDSPLENDAYEELSPLLMRIELQHRHIEYQLNCLKQKQDEFAAITQNMNEGLVLMNDKLCIISINPAAMRLFDTTMDCIGEDFVTIERSYGICEALNTALRNGHGECFVERNGRRYQLDLSRICADDIATGVVLLAFDVTEKAYLERNRREFSANVSHELKTPLQSITGSAELIESGLVKPEDTLSFVRRIRSEAERLVTLVDDIMRLSQLDEGGEMPHEKVDLYELVNNVAMDMASVAALKQVSISTDGSPAQINGVRRLLYEIVYNLCDNAVKYNVDGGSVNISVAQVDNHVILSVKDTGIGIPKEHQSRIFERFYRVDKSHSKKSGGTGLGLSIVKHAAQYHNATIELDSELNMGTCITVSFPIEG